MKRITHFRAAGRIAHRPPAKCFNDMIPAALLLVMNPIGPGPGPTWMGAVSDWVRPAHLGNSLQSAFYSLVPLYVLAVAMHLLLARQLKRGARQ